MGGKNELPQNVMLNITDSLISEFTNFAAEHPTVSKNCSLNQDYCTIFIRTITEPIYSIGNDLSIFNFHLTIPDPDITVFPNSASELRTKLISRQNVFYRAGITDANESFNILDNQSNRCKDINAKAWEYALKEGNKETVKRFELKGQPLVFGKDFIICNAGPCWLLTPLKFSESSDKTSMVVSSPQLTTPIDYFITSFAGVHYCKVLSPARAMEWLYVDGLRAHNSVN